MFEVKDEWPLDEKVVSHKKSQKRKGQTESGPSQKRQRRGGRLAAAARSEKQTATDSSRRRDKGSQSQYQTEEVRLDEGGFRSGTGQDTSSHVREDPIRIEDGGAVVVVAWIG